MRIMFENALGFTMQQDALGITSIYAMILEVDAPILYDARIYSMAARIILSRLSTLLSTIFVLDSMSILL